MINNTYQRSTMEDGGGQMNMLPMATQRSKLSASMTRKTSTNPPYTHTWFCDLWQDLFQASVRNTVQASGNKGQRNGTQRDKGEIQPQSVRENVPPPCSHLLQAVEISLHWIWLKHTCTSLLLGGKSQTTQG